MKWIFILLLFISGVAIGQTEDSTKYIHYKYQYGSRMARFWSDSANHIPYGDTALFGKPQMPGHIMMHTDKNVYKWDSTKWVGIGAATQLTDTSFIVGADTIRITGLGGGITELTGDVTAGPGSGSQAATIANNAVTNAKLAQAAALTVKGNPTNGTANAQDIAAAVASTYLKRTTTQLLWDSIPWEDIKNKPDLQNPGVYFSPAQSFDPTFVVAATCIPYPTSTFSHGAPITYGILDQATGHNSSFYDTVYGHPSNARIVVGFPPVRNVLNSKILPDETLSGYGLHMGPTVGINTFEAPAYQTRTVGITLIGDGSGNWTKTADFGLSGSWDVTTFSTANGGTSFNINAPIHNPSYNEIVIKYVGPNGYEVNRVYTGLGAYNARFVLTDAFNNPVTINPTTSDRVVIVNGGMQEKNINLTTYLTGSNEFIAGSFVNFWVDGKFECWLVAAPTSTTSTLVRWQTNYPSATNYKIYRSTTKYGARTLIHTGTEGSYTDTGLSPATLYYYHMEAVVGGVDTYVTYFTTNTK